MRKVTIADKSYYCDNWSTAQGDTVFLSIYGYSYQIDVFMRTASSDRTIKNLKDYYIERSTDSTTSITHLCMLKKPTYNSETRFFSFYLLNETDTPSQAFYEHLNDLLNVPMKPEWSEYIFDTCMGTDIIRREIITLQNRRLAIYLCAGYESRIQNIIVQGVRDGVLKINGDKKSSLLEADTTLDTYLCNTSEELARRIQTIFTPRFNPLTDAYSQTVLDFEDWCYNNGKGFQLFDAQKSIIESTVRCLKDEHVAFIVGEMGCGRFLPF